MTPMKRLLTIVMAMLAMATASATKHQSLFGSELWENYDTQLLKYVDDAYLAYLDGRQDDRFEDMHFESGSWDVLSRQMGAETPAVAIDVADGRMARVCWSFTGQQVTIFFPVSYDVLHGGTRGDIEDEFVAGLRNFTPKARRSPKKPRLSDLEQIDGNLYRNRGASYMIAEANADTYLLVDDDTCDYLVDTDYPACTLANMIHTGAGYDALLDITVIRHEYGTTDSLQIPLEAFIQYCKKQKCDIYWGVSEAIDGRVSGTIFCCNPVQGYDHVARLWCDTSALGTADFTIKCRLSLFVPVNNIQNILE